MLYTFEELGREYNFPRVSNYNSILKVNLFFNWRIIALQKFIVFCQISTWISHRYTYMPSLLKLPPIFLTIPSLLVDTEPLFEFPEPYSKFPLAIYFAYGIASFHVTHDNLVTASGLITPFGPETVTIYLYSVRSLRGGISKANSYPWIRCLDPFLYIWLLFLRVVWIL